MTDYKSKYLKYHSNDTRNIYKSKYLKYKNKYFKLKNQIGGSNKVSNVSILLTDQKLPILGKINNIDLICQNKNLIINEEEKDKYKYLLLEGDKFVKKSYEDYDRAGTKYVCNINLDFLKYGNLGLRNMGNTCFSAAYLQAFSFMYDFVFEILNNYDLYKDNQQFKLFKDFIDSKSKVGIAASNYDNKIVDPKDFKNIYPCLLNNRQGSAQEDAGEAILTFLLNLNTVNISQTLTDADKRMGNILGLKYNEIIRRDEITIEKKKYKEEIPDEKKKNLQKWYLTVNIKPGKSIQELIYNFFEEEILPEPLNDLKIKEDDRTIHDIQPTQYKKYTLKESKKILIISLNRYEYFVDYTNKKTFKQTKIEFPVKITNQIELNENIYDLACIIYQTGSVGGGHYYTYINRPEFENQLINEKFKAGWYVANDSTFEAIGKNRNFNNEFHNKFHNEFHKGYLYFYVKRDNTEKFPHIIENTNIRYKYNDYNYTYNYTPDENSFYRVLENKLEIDNILIQLKALPLNQLSNILKKYEELKDKLNEQSIKALPYDIESVIGSRLEEIRNYVEKNKKEEEDLYKQIETSYLNIFKILYNIDSTEEPSTKESSLKADYLKEQLDLLEAKANTIIIEIEGKTETKTETTIKQLNTIQEALDSLVFQNKASFSCYDCMTSLIRLNNIQNILTSKKKSLLRDII